MTNGDRTGAFWERHDKLMQDPEHAARFNTELARIRAVDAQVNADDTLRTALTKLAEKWFAPDAVASRLTKSATQGLVPASDTRREDVAQVDLVADTLAKAFAGPHCAAADLHGADCATPGGCYYHDAARAVLAVLPAPPVVDEAEALIEAHVAEFEASISRLEASIHDPNNTFGGREYDTAKLHGQRGAVYALRRLADEIAARLRGATRG